MVSVDNRRSARASHNRCRSMTSLDWCRLIPFQGRCRSKNSLGRCKLTTFQVWFSSMTFQGWCRSMTSHRRCRSMTSHSRCRSMTSCPTHCLINMLSRRLLASEFQSGNPEHLNLVKVKFYLNSTKRDCSTN